MGGGVVVPHRRLLGERVNKWQDGRAPPPDSLSSQSLVRRRRGPAPDTIRQRREHPLFAEEPPFTWVIEGHRAAPRVPCSGSCPCPMGRRTMPLQVISEGIAFSFSSLYFFRRMSAIHILVFCPFLQITLFNLVHAHKMPNFRMSVSFVPVFESKHSTIYAFHHLDPTPLLRLHISECYTDVIHVPPRIII